MTAVTVLAVASEIFPLIKTGGLADVAGALPPALAAEDVQTITLVPGYPAVLRGLIDAAPVHALRRPVRRTGDAVARTRGRAGPAGDRRAASLCPAAAILMADRTAATGRITRSGSRRWAAVAALLAGGDVAGIVPDILHAHDWQAGLALAYLHYRGGRRPGTVMTVHNLAFQGRFPAGAAGHAGPAAGRLQHRRRRVLRRYRLPEGRPVLCRPDHHRLPHLRRGDPHARRAAWGWTACCAPAPRCCTAS